jgi:hypothetical protein
MQAPQQERCRFGLYALPPPEIGAYKKAIKCGLQRPRLLYRHARVDRPQPMFDDAAGQARVASRF